MCLPVIHQVIILWVACHSLDSANYGFAVVIKIVKVMGDR